MNKWGIILLVLATLANAGGVYLLMEDRAKRRDISDAIARHYLALNGLPLDGAKIDGDSIDMKVRTANGVPVPLSSTDVLKKYLDAAGGAQFGASGPIANQVDEVNRVAAQVETVVAGLQTPKLKVDFLAGSFANTPRGTTFTPGILIYLADTFEEREAARALAADPNKGASATAALEKFKAKAAAVVPATLADPLRRQAIAHFLAALEPTSDDWQKRVAQVVGLRAYVKTLAEQDLAFQEIASRVTRRIEDDQAAFVTQYQQLQALSIERSLLLSRELAIRNDLDQQAQKDTEVLTAKQSAKAKAEKNLDDLQKAVAAQSSINAALESDVHATQRTVGKMLDEILKLEADLDAAEQQRKGR
jgi:hypothetical protein